MSETSDWKVLKHDPMVKLSERVFTVEGDLPNMALRRRMTLVRRDDGSLLVHNAINCDAETMAAIEALGAPSLVVVPNGLHRLDVAAWKKRYPKARVVSGAGARDKVEKMAKVDVTYEDLTLEDSIRVTLVEGLKRGMGEGCFSVRDAGGTTTLIFNDALFNVPHQRGFGGFVLKLMGSSGGPKVTPLMKTVGVHDKRALANAFRALAKTEGLARVVPGHGAVVSERADEVLRGVGDRLSL